MSRLRIRDSPIALEIDWIVVLFSIISRDWIFETGCCRTESLRSASPNSFPRYVERGYIYRYAKFNRYSGNKIQSIQNFADNFACLFMLCESIDLYFSIRINITGIFYERKEKKKNLYNIYQLFCDFKLSVIYKYNLIY